jgi:hypothetical protein
MTDAERGRGLAKRLAERAKTEPSTITDDEFEEAVSMLTAGLSTDDRDDSDDAETRRLASEAVRHLVYHDQSVLEGRFDAVCAALRAGQSVVTTRSRVERMGSHLRDTVESQLALLDTLRRYGYGRTEEITDPIVSLMPAFTNGRVHERITASYLSLVDICVFRQDGAVDVNLGQFVDLAAESGPEIHREVVDIFHTLATDTSSRVADRLNPLLDAVAHSDPTVQRKAIRLVSDVIAADPQRVHDYQTFLRDRIEHPTFEIRVSARCAVRALPFTSVRADHGGIDELVTALDDPDSERRRIATDVLSNYPGAVLASDLPVEPIVDALGADDRIVVLSASKLLNRVARTAPDRLDGHVGAILDELTTLTAHAQYPGIAVVETIAENEPELVAPHVKPIVTLVTGSTDPDGRLQNRLGDFVTRLQRSSGADPRIRHQSDALRASLSYSTVVEREYQDLDGRSLISYRALGVLLSLVDAAPEPIVDRIDGIVTGLNYESHAIRRRTVVILIRLSKTHPEAVFPFLGYITDAVRDTIDDPDASALRIGSLYLLLRVLIRSERDPEGLARDVNPIFELLSPALFDDGHRPIERSAVVLLLKYAYVRRFMPSKRISSDGSEGYSDQELLEASQELLESDDPGVAPEQVDSLLAFGQQSHGRNRANIVSILSKITVADVSTTVLALPTLFDWVAADESPRGASESGRTKSIEPVGENPTEADLEAYAANRIDRLLDASDNDLEAAAANVVLWISHREPMALVPFVDDVLSMLSTAGREPRQKLLSAVENLLDVEPALTPDAVRAADTVLIDGSVVVRESAAHLLAMAARQEPALVAESTTGLVAPVRNAESDATALFALTALSRIAEIEPGALADLDRTLAGRLGEWRTSAVTHRDVSYVSGTSPNYLMADTAANERTLDRMLRRTLATVVDGHGSMDEWDTATLVAVAASETGVAPAAATELVARHRESGIGDHAESLRRAVADGKVSAAVERIAGPIVGERDPHPRSDEPPA